MGVNLVVVGVSHHTAPVDVRERLAFPAGELEPALKSAAELAKAGGPSGEAMIVSTCNRVELYMAAGAAEGLRPRIAALLEQARSMGDLDRYLYERTGDDALQHLFRVAASLDSLVIGEPQILGQVKDAYEAALKAGTVGPVLGQIVPRAFAAAKRVRSETTIARSSASVASVAVELGKRIFGELGTHEVLVVGAGEMGELAAKHFVSDGCKRLLVINRTFSRGEELVEKLRAAGAQAEAHPWDAMDRLLARADVVLSSTGAADPVISREMIVRAMKARKGRWLCLLDIAVPRDIEPAIASIDNVYLYDVDALTRIVDENMAERRREAEAAERIVVEEVKRVQEGWKALGVVPTIRALRDRFSEIARAEAQRTLGKLNGLNEKQQREVQMMADSIVNKLLHAPLTALKREADSASLVQAVHQLFELHDIAPAPGPGGDRPLLANPGSKPAQPHSSKDPRPAQAAAGDEPNA